MRYGIHQPPMRPYGLLGDLVASLRRLEARGQLGGVLALFAALGLGVGGGWMIWQFGPWNEWGVWYPFLAGAGVILIGLGAYAVVVSARAFSRPRFVQPDRSAFLFLLRNHPQPFRVCLKCRLVVDFRECRQCMSTDDCFDVTSPADVRAVSASLV